MGKIPKYARKLRKKSMADRRRGVYSYAPEGVPQKPLNRQYRKMDREYSGHHGVWMDRARRIRDLETMQLGEWIMTSDPRLRVDSQGNVWLQTSGEVKAIHTHVSVSIIAPDIEFGSDGAPLEIL